MHKKAEDYGYWCVVNNSEIWLLEGELPLVSAEQWQLPKEHAVYLGHYQQHPVYWLNASDCSQSLPLVNLYECLHWQQALFLLASKAVQYGHMQHSQRFCSVCGGRNYLNHREIAMQCQDCRTLHYPRIFPCIIVAVQKDDAILLAQHAKHKSGMYTVIAGFAEVGETLEQCVAREVKEETGIEVTNIRYFGSQPWAFPSSLMMGFLADYHSGEIKPDYVELTDAAWFTADHLPQIAPKGTIAHALIQASLTQSMIKMKV